VLAVPVPSHTVKAAVSSFLHSFLNINKTAAATRLHDSLAGGVGGLHIHITLPQKQFKLF
jgi:hypothetical protein